MRIRNKLILMLAIPLAALALVGALGFRDQSSTAQQVSSALRSDGVVQSLNLSIKAIGVERLAYVSNTIGPEVDELRQATDGELAQTQELAAAEGLPGVQAAASNAVADLAAARSNGDRAATLRAMNETTATLRSTRSLVTVEYPSQDSFAEATSINYAVDVVDRQDSIWLEYIVADEITPDLAKRVAMEDVATRLLRTQLIDIAPESHIGPLNASLASEADKNIERMAIAAADLFARSEPQLADDQALAAVIASHDDWYGHAVMLQNDVAANLADRATAAEGRQNLFALLGTLGLLVLFGLIYVVYRSVVEPLNELLDGAEKVAHDRLPSVVSELRTMGSNDSAATLEPLPRRSDDELGSLVDAFNDVQLTAFDLAVEQARSRRNIAEMFVNLGRRNQKLLQRMLDVLSELEVDETDADKLERLFQLDHMTTRMRRNAESLLVVAGTTTPRQWAKSVPAADVVRSALAEVQEYQRIDVLLIAEAPMAGAVITDVAHLLAELLENSLQFSEPESRVSVAARWTNDGYRIMITDQGFGMTAAELAEHNSLIANPPPPDQAPTRFLGLFVVGHLAVRHDINVVLSEGADGGTQAWVTIPAALMTDRQGTERPAALPALDSGEASTTVVGAQLSNATLAPIAQAAAHLETEITAGDLPVRGRTLAVEASSAITAAEMAGEAAPAPVAQPELTGDLPVRSSAAPVAPVRSEVPIDFGAAPEQPAYAPSAVVAPEPVANPTPAPEPHTFVEASQPVAEAATYDLPVREPRADFEEFDGFPDELTAPANAASITEPDDVATAASNVGSMFSSFQAGVRQSTRSGGPHPSI